MNLMADGEHYEVDSSTTNDDIILKKTNYKRILSEKSANEFKKKKNPLNTQNRRVNIEIGIQFKWNKHYKDGSNCKKRA